MRREKEGAARGREEEKEFRTFVRSSGLFVSVGDCSCFFLRVWSLRFYGKGVSNFNYGHGKSHEEGGFFFDVN